MITPFFCKSEFGITVTVLLLDVWFPFRLLSFINTLLAWVLEVLEFIVIFLFSISACWHCYWRRFALFSLSVHRWEYAEQTFVLLWLRMHSLIRHVLHLLVLLFYDSLHRHRVPSLSKRKRPIANRPSRQPMISLKLWRESVTTNAYNLCFISLNVLHM